MAKLMDPVRLCEPAAALEGYGRAEVDFLARNYSQPISKGDLSKRVRLEWRTAAENPTLLSDANEPGSEASDSDDRIPPYIDCDQVKVEWMVVRPLLLAACAEWKQQHSNIMMKAADVLQLLVTKHATAFPHFVKLIVACSVIPIEPADNERGFSAMKHHKTDLRSLLGADTLDQLMRISLEGPDYGTKELDDIIVKAVDLWAGKKNRRCDDVFNMPSRLDIARRKRARERRALEKAENTNTKVKTTSKMRNAGKRAAKRLRSRAAREAKEKQTVDAELKDGAPEKEVTPGELNESENAALAQLAKAKKKKTEAEEKRQQLLAEHAKNDCPRRKVTSRKLLEALESKVAKDARR
jgi:hypothetical protein